MMLPTPRPESLPVRSAPWLLAILLLAATGLISAADITSGLIGKWSFEGDFTDDLGTNAPGSGTNNVGFTNGFIGSALFPTTNGSNPRYGNLGRGPEITNICVNNNQFTMAAWIFYRTSNFAPGSPRATILARAATNAFIFAFDLNETNRALRFNYTHSWGGGQSTTESGPIPTNTWIHVAVVSTGTAIHIYTNGWVSSSTSITWVSLLGSTNADLTVGGRGNSLTNVFNGGAIDDVRIYNRALSAADMQALGGPPNFSVNNVSSNTAVPSGFAFRGSSFSPTGLKNAQLLVTNDVGGGVLNTPATLDTNGGWSAPVSLPLGNYTAVLIASNSNGVSYASAAIPFAISNFSSLTIRSVDAQGTRLPDRILFGPRGFEPTGLRTNDAAGEVTFPSFQEGLTLNFSNINPAYTGLATEITNFTMPGTNAVLVWTLGAGSTARFYPSVKSTPFMTAGTADLRLPVSLNGMGRPNIQVTFIRLADGLRKTVFDGTQYTASGDQVDLVLSRALLTRSLSPGPWILETRLRGLDKPEATARVTRQWFFYAP